MRKQVVVIIALVFCSILQAKIKLPAILSDNMVMRQNADTPLWGQTSPNETVTVKCSWSGDEYKTKSDNSGKWKISVATPASGGTHTVTIKDGDSEVTLSNILMGEVWLCGGQSNMRWEISRLSDAQKILETCDSNTIRLFKVDRTVEFPSRSDVAAVWTACDKETVADFSAVGYLYGRILSQQLGVPVGLIECDWGASSVEAWFSRAELERYPEYKQLLSESDELLKQYQPALAQWRETERQYNKEVEQAAKEGRKEPTAPRMPYEVSIQKRAAAAYENMVEPIIGYGITGVIFYQGEANANRAYQYRKLFPRMITLWRNQWQQGDFPFYFVQLANFGKPLAEPADDAWAEIRQAQAMALSLPKTGMASAIDIGDAANIHPDNKLEVARRLSLIALADTYAKDIAYSGAVYKSMKIDKGKIIITFDHTGGKLTAKGGELAGFAIAGADRKFVWADAEISGDTVIVSSPLITEPVAVRYGWARNPQSSLYNKASLPATPFRTDDWPGLTDNNNGHR